MVVGGGGFDASKPSSQLTNWVRTASGAESVSQSCQLLRPVCLLAAAAVDTSSGEGMTGVRPNSQADM
eukprot:scaffold324172_cov33-Prasinocladus_malaysianus.AAC.1